MYTGSSPVPEPMSSVLLAVVNHIAMNAIVEGVVRTPFFQAVLEAITDAPDVDGLRFLVHKLNDHIYRHHLLIGWGGSHMWVSDPKTDKRLILVPFN